MNPVACGTISNRLLTFASFWVLLFGMVGHSNAQTLPVSFVARIDSPLPGPPVGGSPGCVAAADFNSDGNLDIVTCGNANNIWVLLGNGDGTFQPAVTYIVGTTYPDSVMLGDFNGDGKPDILVVNADSTVSVLLNKGDGTFQAQVVTSISTNPRDVVAVGDFNGDGKADIAVPVAVAQHGDSALSILLGNGDGTFQSPINSSGYTPTPNSIQVADFNRDGKLDVLWEYGGAVTVFLGNGDGTVQQPLNTATGTYDRHMTVADFNNDGFPDVAVLDSSTYSILVFLGKGDGTFGTGLPSQADLQSSPISVGDFNGDGKPDIVSTDGSVTLSILLGNGDGTFQKPVSYYIPGYAIATGDFNGDGRLDVVGSAIPSFFVEGTLSILSVALGKGDGGFLLDTYVYASCSCRGVTDSSILITDLNGDGKPDLVSVQGSLEYGTFVATLLGNGNGTFQKPNGFFLGPGPSTAANAAAGDFNNDGKLDLAVVVAGYVGVLLGNGDGTFQPVVEFGNGNAVFVAVGDFNRDGNLDIVTADGTSGTVSVLLGNGDGTFGFAKSFPGGGTYLVVADFNNDGKLDVAGSSAVILGNGDGTFGSPIDYPTGGGGAYLAIGDFNHDGNLDVVGSNSSSVAVMLGNGDGTFGTPKDFVVGNTPTSVAVSDFNGDGKADIAVLNAGWFDVSVLLGNGDGTFQPATYFAAQTGYLGTSIAAADLNGDGFPDIAIAGVALLFNRPPGADASLSPNTLNFGNQEVGTRSTPQQVTLFNLGQAGLTINNISFSGPQAADFSETNTCGGSVAAGTGCKISVKFTPTATGMRSASLTITDNGIRSPQTVPLSGTGVSLALGIASGGCNSATVSAGQTANYNLTIGGGGVGGTATLSCTGAPQGASCMLPGSVSLSASSATPFSVSVTTTSRTMSALAPSGLRPARWLWAMGVLGLVTLPGGLGRRTGRRWRRSLPLLLLLLVCSCGGDGSSSGSQANPNGTPAGTYPLQVTAKSGSMNQSIQLTLIVQ